jgi:hypothetical protein
LHFSLRAQFIESRPATATVSWKEGSTTHTAEKGGNGLLALCVHLAGVELVLLFVLLVGCATYSAGLIGVNMFVQKYLHLD